MSYRKDLYSLVAQVGVGAALLAAGPAPGAAAGMAMIGIAGLTGLFRDKSNTDLQSAVTEAEQAAANSLKSNPEIDDKAFKRAETFLREASWKIDPTAYAAAARIRPESPEGELAQGILATINFAGDEDAKGILEKTLPDAIRVGSLHPKLVTEITRAFQIQNAQDSAETLALVKELNSTKQTTVPEDTLIAMARKIRPRVANKAEALNELDRAADLAADMASHALQYGNSDAFVDEVMQRLNDLTAQGDLDTATSEADKAFEEWEERQQREAANGLRLLGAAIDQHMLAFDADGAASKIARRVTLETPDPAAQFAALRTEQNTWYERGRDNGLRLDLEIAIALARIAHEIAQTADERGMALNNLGAALATLGGREASTDRLEQAVTAYTEALKEFTRDRVPLDWAKTQMNLGNALTTLGGREASMDRLETAVAAYTEALKENTRDRAPMNWAMTQMNLGTALQALGQREASTDRLEQAVTAYTEALKEYTRDRVPLDWGKTQMGLGNALAALGEREASTDRLEQAVTAYTEALKECTRNRVPMDWAMTQMNFGNALQALGQREASTDRLEQAVTAYTEALKERTRNRVPMDWAMTQGNICNVHLAFSNKTGDAARLDKAQTALNAARDVFEEANANHYLAWCDKIQARINACRA